MCVRASPGSGRSAAAASCPSMSTCASTSSTSRTGRCCTTCSSLPRPSPSCCCQGGPTNPPVGACPVIEDAAPILSAHSRQRTRPLQPLPRAGVMGVPLDACSAEQLVATVERWVDDGDRQFAVGVNAHLVNLANRDPELAALLQHSGLNYADGQSVVWAARLLGHDVPARVPTTEMIYPIAEMLARRRFPVFLLGGRPEVRSEEHTSELQSRRDLVCRLLLEKKKKS